MSATFWTGLQMDYDAARTKDSLSGKVARIKPWPRPRSRSRSRAGNLPAATA
jgi:hypothetical protein